MVWVLVDVLIGLLAVAFLVVVIISGFRHIKALGRAAKAAGARLDEAMPPSPSTRS